MTLDKAIRHCEEVADRCAVTDGGLKCEMEHRQLAEWLKELKLRRTEHRWIPCSERLPTKPDGEAVYEFEGHDTAADEYIVMISGAILPTALYWTGEEWFSPYGIDAGYTYNVLAWMPLPEPYQEGKNE